MKPYTGIWVYKRGWTAYIIKVSGNRKKPWYKVLKTIDLWNTSPHDFEWYCKSLEYIRKHDLYFRGEIHE